MELLDRLQEIGVDVTHSLERFAGNQALYVRFINKFPQDPNLALLTEAMAAKDYESALTHAHTLKGVSANLGMMKLSDLCASLVAQFRSENYEGLDDLLQQTLNRYQQIIDAIQQP